MLSWNTYNSFGKETKGPLQKEVAGLGLVKYVAGHENRTIVANLQFVKKGYFVTLCFPIVILST